MISDSGGEANGKRPNFLGREGTGRLFRTAFLALLATAASTSGAEVDFFSGRALAWASAFQTLTVHAADVDGDGDMDLLAAERSTMVWFENTDGHGTFAEAVQVGRGNYSPSTVFAADMDGDGDLDYVAASASWPGDGIYWLENTDGKGNFSYAERYVYVEDEVQGVNWATAADLNGDGSVDILYAGGRYDETVGWYANKGTGAFSNTRTIISTTSDSPDMVITADLNGDDSPDVLLASFNDGRITWYENNGIGSFPPVGVDLVSGVIGATYVSAADIDGDGDMDVIATFYGTTFTIPAQFMVFRNMDGAGTFSDGEVVGIVSGARSMVAADFDGDLDVDLLGCSDSGTILWYENIDGKGTFANQTIIALDIDPFEAIAVDIDGDGDLDVVSAVWTSGDVVWYENLRSIPSPSTPSPTMDGGPPTSPTASPIILGGAVDAPAVGGTGAPTASADTAAPTASAETAVPTAAAETAGPTTAGVTAAPTAAAGETATPTGGTSSSVRARTVNTTDAPASSSGGGGPTRGSRTPTPTASGTRTEGFV